MLPDDHPAATHRSWGQTPESNYLDHFRDDDGCQLLCCHRVLSSWRGRRESGPFRPARIFARNSRKITSSAISCAARTSAFLRWSGFSSAITVSTFAGMVTSLVRRVRHSRRCQVRLPDAFEIHEVGRYLDARDGARQVVGGAAQFLLVMRALLRRVAAEPL